MIKSLASAICIFTCSLSFSQDNIPKSSWISDAVKIDGNAGEWNQPLRYYDDKTRLFFAFANDDRDLYLCFQTTDESNRMKIMRAGMEITLTTKNKHKVSINFPLVQPIEQPAEAGNENNGQQKFNRKNMETALLAQDTLMEVKGFSTRNGLISTLDASGINAAINSDENNKFTYEISIPLKELYGMGYTPADISKDISLNVKVNAFSKQNNSGNRGGNGFSQRGGGGRMNGGGRRGGGMNRRGDTNGEEGNAEQGNEYRTAMFEKSEFKEKFILAQNNPK